MKYLLGLIIIGLYFIFLDSYIVKIVLSILTGIVIYKYEIREDQKIVSMGQLIAKLFIVSVIAFIILLGMYFFMGDSGAGDGYVSIRKKLHVTIKDNNPCFYVDSFEGIDDFDIDYFNVEEIRPPAEWINPKFMWRYSKDANNTLQLSTFVGVDQCIPYGRQINLKTIPSKKLQMDVLYNIKMEGTKRNIPEKKLKNGDGIWLYGAFYLVKNQKNGEINIILPSNSEVNDMVKKMEDQNKSIKPK